MLATVIITTVVAFLTFSPASPIDCNAECTEEIAK